MKRTTLTLVLLVVLAVAAASYAYAARIPITIENVSQLKGKWEGILTYSSGPGVGHTINVTLEIEVDLGSPLGVVTQAANPKTTKLIKDKKIIFLISLSFFI